MLRPNELWPPSLCLTKGQSNLHWGGSSSPQHEVYATSSLAACSWTMGDKERWFSGIKHKGGGATVIINSHSHSWWLCGLARPSPFASSGAARMADHRRGVGWIRSRSEGRRTVPGLNPAGYRPPRTKWNRSRPSDTTTFSQLQNRFPKPEQWSRRRAGSFEHGRFGLRL